MDTLVSMRIFRQVVESGGFTAASETLDLSVATVSKHIQHLETQLGTRLLNRTSRRMSLTSAGGVYYEHCCELLEKHEIVENEVRCTGVCPRGILRVSAPTWFANRFFADLLKSYSLQYPEVSLDLSLSDSRSDLVEEALDVALRVTRDRDPREPARQLGEIRFCLAASHDYLSRHGVPQSVAELAQHEMISYAHYDGWLDLPPAANPTRWRLNNTTLIAHMALQGLGIAMLPDVLIAQEPDLVPVLSQTELPPASLLAITHRSRHLSVRASSFIEHLAAHFGGEEG